jgi:hypothetical protein
MRAVELHDEEDGDMFHRNGSSLATSIALGLALGTLPAAAQAPATPADSPAAVPAPGNPTDSTKLERSATAEILEGSVRKVDPGRARSR